jgi:sugar/nucleoside kinase (ribokinase family)
LGEVPLGVARLFTRSFLGFSPQGWLREVRSDGAVRLRPWSEHASLKGGSVVVASEEDIEGDDVALKHWRGDVPIVVITEGERGARVYSDGRWRHVAAFPCDSPDPTGAGDVFAAAFLAALHEGKDVAYAAAFASAAAVLSIRAPGLASIAGRDEIERLMAAHPEVVLE